MLADSVEAAIKARNKPFESDEELAEVHQAGHPEQDRRRTDGRRDFTLKEIAVIEEAFLNVFPLHVPFAGGQGHQRDHQRGEAEARTRVKKRRRRRRKRKMKTTIHSGDLQNAADNVWNAGTRSASRRSYQITSKRRNLCRGGAGVRNLADLRWPAADGGDQ